MKFSHDVSCYDWTKRESRDVLYWGMAPALQILPKHSWMARASFQACRGAGVMGKMLFLSYLVGMAVFASAILVSLKCHISTHCRLDAIKGTALRWEEGVICSSPHMLLLRLIFFKKRCDLERRCTIWMMLMLQGALGVISLFIPPGRKKNESRPVTLVHRLRMQRLSGRNNK